MQRGSGNAPAHLLVGGVELGGTSVRCAIGTGPDDLRLEARVATTTPEETLAAVVEFLGRHPLAAVGVASFGPLDLDQRSPSWGFITATTKPGWSNTDVVGTLHRALGVPIAIDTDVNGAALGEFRWGAGRGLDSVVYVTVGTGIGGGGIIGGHAMRGLVHPEMGHMRIPHDRTLDVFAGNCPFHGDCLEGLASGRALRERWGAAPESLPPDHPAWSLEARYLALGLANIVCTLSPRRIVLGGGVMRTPGLLEAVRRDVVTLLAAYVRAPALGEQVDEYIVAPALGERAGVLGAIALGQHM